MLSLRKIAITGGIATGKTTVCRILNDHGAFTLSSDAIVHQILEEDTSCKEKILSLFGSEILTDGKIDRKKVATIVFDDENQLKALESILHPLLLNRINEEFKKVKKEERHKYFVVEFPLVQEIGKEEDFDLIVALVSDSDKALKRFTEAGFTKESFLKRSARQWDPPKKANYADYVIENLGTVEDLKQKVLEMMKEIDSQ